MSCTCDEPAITLPSCCQLQLKVTLDDSSKFFGAAFTSISMVVFISLPLTSTVFAHKP